MAEGLAMRLCTAVGTGRVTFKGPLPVPIGTEQIAREALSPLPQYAELPYSAVTVPCRAPGQNVVVAGHSQMQYTQMTDLSTYPIRSST